MRFYNKHKKNNDKEGDFMEENKNNLSKVNSVQNVNKNNKQM